MQSQMWDKRDLLDYVFNDMHSQQICINSKTNCKRYKEGG